MLVLGIGDVGLMTCLMRRGCLAVTTLRPEEKPDAAAYDTVLVQDVPEHCQVDDMVRRAHRALVIDGEFVAYVGGMSAGRRAYRLDRSLRLDGFICVRTHTLAEGVLVQATLPVFGAIACA